MPKPRREKIQQALTFSGLSAVSAVLIAGIGYLRTETSSAGAFTAIVVGLGFALVGIGYAWKIRSDDKELWRTHIWLKANVTRVQPPSAAEGDNDWWIVAEITASDGKKQTFTSDPASKATATQHLPGDQVWVLVSPHDHEIYRVILKPECE